MDGWVQYSPAGTETGIFRKALKDHYVIVTARGVMVCRPPAKGRLSFSSHTLADPGLQEFLSEHGLASFLAEIEAVAKNLRDKEDGEGLGDPRLKLKPVPDEDPEDEDGPSPR